MVVMPHGNFGEDFSFPPLAFFFFSSQGTENQEKLEREKNLSNDLIVVLLPLPTSEGLSPEAIRESSFSPQI